MILPTLITTLVCLGIVLMLAWYRIGIRSRVLWVSVACFAGGLIVGNVVMGRSVVMTACMVAFAIAGLAWSRRGHTGTALHFNGVRIGETRGIERVPAVPELGEWSYRMSPADREEQRRSFAYGNASMSNPSITRADIDRAVERMGGDVRKVGSVVREMRAEIKERAANDVEPTLPGAA